jgi:hypothetical protein
MLTSPEAADLCFRYLNSQKIIRIRLKLIPLGSFAGLDPCYLYCRPEVFVPRSSYRRFKQDIPNSANRVSPSLHFSISFAQKNSNFTDKHLMELLKSIDSQPIRLRKASSKTRINMWFVDYKTENKAIKVLMRLQGIEHNKGTVRISFTKPRREAPDFTQLSPLDLDLEIDEKMFAVYEPETLENLDISQENETVKKPKLSKKKKTKIQNQTECDQIYAVKLMPDLKESKATSDIVAN